MHVCWPWARNTAGVQVRQPGQLFLTAAPTLLLRRLQTTSDGKATLVLGGTLPAKPASPAQAEPDIHAPVWIPGVFPQDSSHLGS